MVSLMYWENDMAELEDELKAREQKRRREYMQESIMIEPFKSFCCMRRYEMHMQLHFCNQWQ